MNSLLVIDEFYIAEGTSEEEWQRVYDLRYCTILVPFENNPCSNKNIGQSKEKQDDFNSQVVQVKQEPDELKEDESKTSVVAKRTSSEPVYLATPRATPARYCALFSVQKESTLWS
jgi:hypothetical protein